MRMRVKICGITHAEQGRAIARSGATALGFICVPSSPRYVRGQQIQEIIAQLPQAIDCIGVFANASPSDICNIVKETNLTGVQLHGQETPELCQELRQLLPETELIKALRVKTRESLGEVAMYSDAVDTLLLDAYHPQLLGGTGHALDWEMLRTFNPKKPWFLAGGLNPENVTEALKQVHPGGIDLSSGVEKAPGDKDLEKVARLFECLNALG